MTGDLDGRETFRGSMNCENFESSISLEKSNTDRYRSLHITGRVYRSLGILVGFMEP